MLIGFIDKDLLTSMEMLNYLFDQDIYVYRDLSNA